VDPRKRFVTAGSTHAPIESVLASTGLVYRFLPEKDRCPDLPIGTGSATIGAKFVRYSADGRKEREKQLPAPSLMYYSTEGAPF
jgi:hypothetical protein